jgi:enhancing lycopene biosynthesis protein 2
MCLAPAPLPERYNSHYECMIAGYEESIKKAKEIGAEEVNKYGTIIKFYCLQEKDLPKKGKET